MLQTKLNRHKLNDDYVDRPHLIEKLEKHRHLPLILVSAPAGYGKSILISQWLENEDRYGWLSLDESMNDTPTFLKYFIESLGRSSAANASGFKNWVMDNYFLTWEAIIDLVINELNELKEPFRLILDDYHLIRNQEIHELINTIINEDIPNFRLVIITRRDPSLSFRSLRLYHKMLELRAQDLKFDQNDIRMLLAKERIAIFSDEDLGELIDRTEGWILPIRILVAARSLPTLEGKKEKSLTLSNDLDSLLVHISDKLDPEFFKQLQICSLCDQFSEELIDSVFSHVFTDSGSAAIFLAKLRNLNFFLIPTSKDGTWYRFHHLISDILRRQIERNEPTLIKPLYLKISQWFSNMNLIDEAIHYAIKAENHELACEQIVKHRPNALIQGHWWVLQRWMDKIPRQIRNTNVDILLTELLVCEETWNIEDFSSILETLKSDGMEHSSDENISHYLYHLGYFFTFIKPDPKKALEALERSKALCYDESYMFGGRREVIMAYCRQMLGETTLALRSLEDIEERSEPFSKMHIRATNGKVFVHLISGNFEAANNEAIKLQFLVRDSDLLLGKAWSFYFQGNAAFQSYNKSEVIPALKEALTLKYVLNLRVYFDALAGLVLFSSLKGDTKATESFLMQMNQLATKLKDTKFQNYYSSVKARVSWHTGQGEKELSWAQTDWVKQAPASYFFLIDVPDLTKIRIVVSHGSTTQVEESISVLEEVEAKLQRLHNYYQQTDVLLLKAMGLLRLGRTNLAQDCLKKALSLAEEKDLLRPVIEAYRVMPSLFHSDLISDLAAHRILSRIGLEVKEQKEEAVSHVPKEALSLREEEIVHLIADGLRNKEIAAHLNISSLTVKTHLSNIYRKFEVHNRTSMIRKARNQQII